MVFMEDLGDARTRKLSLVSSGGTLVPPLFLTHLFETKDYLL